MSNFVTPFSSRNLIFQTNNLRTVKFQSSIAKGDDYHPFLLRFFFFFGLGRHIDFFGAVGKS